MVKKIVQDAIDTIERGSDVDQPATDLEKLAVKDLRSTKLAWHRTDIR